MPASTPPACEMLEPFVMHHVADVEPLSSEQLWLIEGLWLQGGVGILGGAPKVCKTFLAAQLSLAVATAKPALGRYPVQRPGPVLFFGAEDSLAALRLRFDGLASAHGDDLKQLPLYLLDVPLLRLDRDKHLQRLRAAIDRCQPRLLVLDPFIRIAKVDENSAAEVSSVLGSLREIQRDFDLAVLVVHHARKSPASHPAQALRGSSDFAAWSDSNLYLARHKQDLTLFLEHRSAPAPKPLRLRLAPDPAPHLVLVDDDDDNDPPAASSLIPLQHDIVACLSMTHRPLPTVELRHRLCKRKQDVVHALAELQTLRRVTRTPRGWLLANHQRP